MQNVSDHTEVSTALLVSIDGYETEQIITLQQRNWIFIWFGSIIPPYVVGITTKNNGNKYTIIWDLMFSKFENLQTILFQVIEL